MSNFKLIKTAAALALGASVVTSAVVPTDASAASKYKISKGKLVIAKTGKVAKGYVTYKSTVYKDGKKLTGLKGKTYYKAGKKATGTYKGAYYYKGAKKVTTGTYKGAYYVKGVKKVTTGLYNGRYYKAGQKATGTYKGAYYVKGTKKVTTGTYNGAYYVKGYKKVTTGLYKEEFYQDGKLSKGYALYKSILYKDAVHNVGLTVFEGKLYDGVSVNKGTEVFEGKLYKGAVLATGLVEHAGLFYNEGALANGIVDGVEYKDGEVVKYVVSSVKAINAEEVTVKFAQPVVNASESKYYEVTVNGKSIQLSDTNSNIRISEDGTLATIRLKSADFTNFKAGDKISVQVADGVTTAKGKKIERFASETFAFEAVAPKLVSANLDKGKTKLVVTFDQPVKAANVNSLVKIDGYTIEKGDNIFTPTTTAGNYTYVIQLPTAGSTITEAQLKEIVKAGQHNVVLFDVANTTPLASNPAVSSSLVGTYNVSEVETAPVVSSVTALNANKFFVVFDQDIKDNKFEIEVNKGVYTFGNENDNGTINTPATKVFKSANTGYEIINGKTEKGYYVVVNEDKTDEANPLYKATEKSVNLSLKITNFKSTGTGLLGTGFNGNVTLSKDANTPYAVEGAIKDKNNLVLTMDQAVDAATITPADVVVKDKNGIIVDNSKYTVNATGKLVTITSTTDLFDVKGKYTVEFKKEIVKYAVHNSTVAGYSLVQNKNEAFSITFGTPDADQYKYYAVPKNAVTLLATNEVLVDYGTSMDKATALNAANYKLDGQALPAGAKLDFYDKDSKVLIKLPEGSLKQSGEYRLTVEKSVQTAKGQSVVKDAQTLDTFVGTFVGADNVAPKLVGAKYLVTDLEYKNDSDATKLELTFSEEVVVSADKNDDDVVAYFGSGASAQEIKGTVAAHPTDKTKVIFTAKDGKVFNVSQSVTVKVLAEKDQKDTTAAIKDAKGNKAEEASVTVTSADKVIDKDQIASDAAAAAALAKAKTDAKATLAAHKSAADYKVNKVAFDKAIADGNTAIEAATTTAAVTTALNNAKAAVDAVKDDQAVVDAEAAKIKAQTLEAAVTTVVLPTVASGFTVAVKTSATPANYSATGELLVAGKSEVVYTVTNTASGKKADSASVEITVVIK